MCAMVFSSGTLGSYVVCALACEVAFHEPALPLLSTYMLSTCNPGCERCCTASAQLNRPCSRAVLHSQLRRCVLNSTIPCSLSVALPPHYDQLQLQAQPCRFSCSAICAYNAIKVTRITVECIIARRAPLGIGGSSLPSPFLAAFIQSFI